MNEKERLRRINNVKVVKEEMKKLRDKKAELNRLKSNEFVKKFLKLSSELDGKEILTEEQIKKREFKKHIYYCECNHEIWYYMGAYFVEYDCGPESRDHYYKASREEDIEYYIYRCLECYEEVEVRKEDNEEFVKQHTILKSNKTSTTERSFDEVRDIYFKLLFTNTTDKAYKKLIKRI